MERDQDMTTYTFDANIFSDLHKDAYGFRPRNHEFYDASDARKQEIWDAVVRDLEIEMENTRNAEARAVAAFDARIQETIALGAGDVETALRWILEGEEFSLHDYQYGADYVAYHFGLPYANQWCEQLGRITHEKVCELYEAAA
jgi:hypothetical protein